MYWRLLILSFFFIFVIHLGRAQDTLKEYKIEEVSVVKSRNTYFSSGQKTTILDSTILHQYKDENIDELLSVISPVYIRSYGSEGSIATTTLRGTTGNHTSVTWNGFPLNSITLGQADLSFAPALFIDKITITHGASGSLFGGGTFGGNIDLKKKVDWKQKNNFRLFAEYGSWESKKIGFNGSTGKNKLKYNLKAFYHDAKNDFEFTDHQKFEQPTETRNNNELTNYGVMQNLYWKLSGRNKFEAGIWYQVKEKNIPEILGVYGTGTATQKDSSLKTYVQYTSIFDHSSLKLRTGYFKDYQLYTEKNNVSDNTYSIFSPVNSERWISNLSYRNHVNKHINFDIGGQYSLFSADAQSYVKHNIKEYRGSIISALQIKYERITSNLSLRQQFNNFTNPKPQVSIGLKYHLLPDKLIFRSNFSTKYRLPTFNDKYWHPGGNKDIMPENGWSQEGGLYFRIKDQNLVKSFSAGLTAYSSRIKNLIQWIPSGKGYWEATNQEDVKSYGLENSLNLVLQTGDFLIHLMENYSHTRSFNISDNESIDQKQLMYVPYNTINSYTKIRYKTYQIGINWSYTSKRFNTNDHKDYMLQPYHVFNIHLTKTFNLNNFKPEIQFKIKNLFDNQYQVIKNYPMPGRAYYINISFQIKNY